MPKNVVLSKAQAKDLVGGCGIDGWEQCADVHVDSDRWMEHRLLIIRSTATDMLYGAEYEQGLTEDQDVQPFEYDDTVTFKPVEAREKTTVEYVYIKDGTGR